MNIVCFPEAGRWVAQCLEFDLCASSDSPAGLPAAFNVAVEGHKAICAAEGLTPFEGLPPAPERYHRMVERRQDGYEFATVLLELGRRRLAIDRAITAIQALREQTFLLHSPP